MANLKPAKSEEEIKKTPVATLRKEYVSLATNYNKFLNWELIVCPTCGAPLSRANFYTDKHNAIGVFPECKSCIIAEVEQRKKKQDKPKETKESVQRILKKMNLPYYDKLYESCCEAAAKETHELNRQSPFISYITQIKSLPQYARKTWDHSEFGEVTIEETPEDIKINQKTIKNAKKRFGNGYTNEDYMFLENQYQDWVTRYECNSKAQEEIFERLAFKKWEINKATKNGQPTKDLDKTYQELLGTANIQPRQSSASSGVEAQTFGTLIQKYEETRPLPDIDPELEDVDKIGLYIDAFYRGHAAKMLGLKNKFTHIYEKVMQKFTVTKPQYKEDEDSEVIFEKIFGSSDIE